MAYKLTYNQLLADLHSAYLDASRKKHSKRYVQRFEAHLEQNLENLCLDLWNRTYKAKPSTCFIIQDPKKREVFAANFRDRIVHHLYYNYTHELYERTFIQDSYSCIKGRGTHYGIRCLEKHIRQESLNYTEPCYVLKMDICGYFMHINRERLLEACLDTLHKMSSHRVLKRVGKTWADCIDMEFVTYLTSEIVLLNPIEHCQTVGSRDDWKDLPTSKSLYYSPAGCGLPIGNLTSQLFSNVYLNVLDQYVKRELQCQHYGRYVDDFYVVSADRMFLHSLIPKIRAFLLERLGLQLHEGKLSISSVYQGLDFLGARLRPHHVEASTLTMARIKHKLDRLSYDVQFGTGNVRLLHLQASLGSFCGVLRHGANYRKRRNLMHSYPVFERYGCFDHAVTKYLLFEI